MILDFNLDSGSHGTNTNFVDERNPISFPIIASFYAVINCYYFVLTSVSLLIYRGE